MRSFNALKTLELQCLDAENRWNCWFLPREKCWICIVYTVVKIIKKILKKLFNYTKNKKKGWKLCLI